MKFSAATTGSWVLGCGIATLCFSFSSVAHAQQPGWATDRFDPAPAGDSFFQSHFPVYDRGGPVVPHFALTTVYAYRPLEANIVDSSGATSQVSVIEHSLATHAQLGVDIARRVGIDASLPVYWFQSGTTDSSYPVHASSSPTLGDLRFGARVRIAGMAERDPVSLHVGFSAYMGFLNFANSAQGTTDSAFRARVFLNGAGTLGIFHWSAMLGFHARPGVDQTYAHVGSEAYANAAIGVSFAHRQLLAGLEGTFSTDIDAAFRSGHMNAEVWAVLRARLLNDALQVGIGAGPGITQAPGTPEVRAMFTIAYTPSIMRSASSSGATPRATSAPGSETTTPQIPGENPGNSPAATTTDAPEAQREQHPDDEPAEPQSGDAPRITLQRFCDVPNTQPCSVGDRDHDGISEPLDQCPEIPVGANPDPERTGCPDGDRDHDTVLDHADQCPDESTGTLADPARAGCPLPDADGDRIADAEDHCPDRPGAPSTDPLINGCPGLVQLDQQTLRILQPIFFAVGRDAIESRSDAVLRSVCEALLARTEIRLMRIEGHTDDNGNDEINVDLSQRRAAAVVHWLIEHGIAPARLAAEGFGSSRPRVAIAPGLNHRQRNEARATNRRVEFEIVPDAARSASNSANTPSTPATQPTPTQPE